EHTPAAAMAPENWHSQYGSTYLRGNLRATAKPSVTAGLKWAAEIGPNADTIARTARPDTRAADSRLPSPPFSFEVPDIANGANTITNVPTSSAAYRRAIPWITRPSPFAPLCNKPPRRS